MLVHHKILGCGIDPVVGLGHVGGPLSDILFEHPNGGISGDGYGS